VVCCLGTNPIQAARLRPDENIFQSPISATNAVAPIGPMPGHRSRQLKDLKEKGHPKAASQFKPADRGQAAAGFDFRRC
jgi:hypothetical protein